MSTTYSGSLSVSANGPTLADSDESNFYVQGNLSVTLNVTLDSSGNVTGGGGVLSGQYAGYAVGEQDSDDDGFSDFANQASLTVSGNVNTGLYIGGTFGGGGYFSFQSAATTPGGGLSGSVTLSDYTAGATTNGTLVLSGGVPAAVPQLTSLAVLAGDVYNATPAGTPGWTVAGTVQTALGQIVTYTNADGSQTVIAVEGTNPANAQDLWADLASFPSGNPTAGLTAYLGAVVADIQQVLAANPHATITLTGHSLGGAVAQMIGEYAGYATTTFNAPGAGQLYTSSAIQNALAPLAGNVAATTGPNVNYRTQGDVVSLIGTPIGNTQTVVPPGSSGDTVWNVLTNHAITTTIADLQAPGTTIQDGTVEPSGNVQSLANDLFSTGQTAVTTLSSTTQAVTTTVNAAADFLGNEFSAWIDPVPGALHTFTLAAGSPLLTAVTFLADPAFAAYQVQAATATGWGAAQTVAAGAAASFAGGTTGIEYEGLTGTGQPTAGSGASLFYAQFAGAGTVNGTLVTACYAAGTRLRAPGGDIAIEHLAVGDDLLTVDGGTLPVVWTGHRRIDCTRHPAPHTVWPVRVAAGAFGDGMPARDLLLSPDHAVFLWGRLFPIRCLINGRTVRQQRVAAVTYWHVELPRHAVVLAEGLPAESYLDVGNRHVFTGGPVVALHPDFARGVWQAQGCAELILGGPFLAAARARLLLQAGLLGHATTDDPAVRVACGRRLLRPETRGNVARFLLPPGAARVRLRSAVGIPGTATPEQEEAGPYGVAVTALLLDRRSVDLADPRLGSGWHGAARGVRWTDGDAALRIDGAREVVLRPAAGGRYWAGAAPRLSRAVRTATASRADRPA